MDSGQVSIYSSFNHPLCGRLFSLPLPPSTSVDLRASKSHSVTPGYLETPSVAHGPCIWVLTSYIPQGRDVCIRKDFRLQILICVDEVPLLVSPVMQAMGWRIVHTWVRPHVYEHSKTAVQVHWEGVLLVVFTATCVCSVAVILAAGRAGVHGWLQVAAIGTVVSETEIFASSNIPLQHQVLPEEY